MQILNEIYKQLEHIDRTKEYFYVTDLGTCPRKVIMNFGSYEKKPQTNAEKIMFYKAENDHRAMARLLNKSKRFSIIKEEFDISEGLPKMWHGRLDSLVFDNVPTTYLVERNVDLEKIKSFAKPRGIITVDNVNSIKKLNGSSIYPIDWKGTRSLKYQVELPKKNHITQLRAYIMALQNMNYDCNKGVLIYSDRTGSYEGIEFVIQPDNDSVLAEMKIYEDWYLSNVGEQLTGIFEYKLPPILERSIKHFPKINEFHLIPNWQCDYCYYEGLSCHPNMSKNKIAEIKDNKLKIRNGYFEYEDRLNEIINPKDDKDFYNFVKRESEK